MLPFYLVILFCLNQKFGGSQCATWVCRTTLSLDLLNLREHPKHLWLLWFCRHLETCNNAKTLIKLMVWLSQCPSIRFPLAKCLYRHHEEQIAFVLQELSGIVLDAKLFFKSAWIHLPTWQEPSALSRGVFPTWPGRMCGWGASSFTTNSSYPIHTSNIYLSSHSSFSLISSPICYYLVFHIGFFKFLLRFVECYRE